jgi:hypothetical protein
VKLEIDETDFGFITSILCRAKLMYESLGCDHNVCAANRDRYREDAKMAHQAWQMMYAAKQEGGAK